MSFQSFKTGFFIAVLSSLLMACSSTSTDDAAGGAGSDVSGGGSGVTTGTVDDVGAYADDLSVGGSLATVFYFDFDKSTLNAEARAALDEHARRLRETPLSIRLEGHGDERGTREYNMALGERRAASVKEYLVLQGVNSDMIEVISYGEERPAALGNDEGSWGLNRRVEMTR